MRCRPAILLLSLALLTLGVLFGQSLPDGSLQAADQPATNNPSGEDETPLPKEERDSITLVADNHAHTGPVLGLFFPPDGRKLLSASRDGTIRTWDVDTGELLRVIRP